MAESTAAVIMWADNDFAITPEREEAQSAVSDIMAMLGVQVGGLMLEKMVKRVIDCSGAAERRGYDLGWTHCEDSIRE